MSLFEWFMEKDNPNPIGEIKDREPQRPSDPINWVTLILGQSIFWFTFYHIINYNWDNEFGFNKMLFLSAILVIYSILGYKTNIEPNYDNMGWLGIFDNPFRYSDDLNRILLFFKIILYLGYLMGKNFIELKKLWRRCFRK